ncbi:hypothetical protein VTI28DRAFT_5953 [Corynascus sepedonium]
MAATPLPGSYPDSIPPTPEETLQQPGQMDHQYHQRNKLHKPGELRGHKHTDSGVVMPDSDPIQSSRPIHSNWRGPDEAVGGGTYVRNDPQATAPRESTRSKLGTMMPTHETEDNTSLGTNDNRNSATAGKTGAIRSVGAAESNTMRSSQQGKAVSNESPPYWGNLPQGEAGAVYNTVRGHGSAADDHEEHHHLPPKSASTSPGRAVIAGEVANYPRGGVYNTVTGHGSQDQESRRHLQQRSLEENSNNERTAVGGPTNETMLTAPLHTELDGRRDVGHHATFDESQDVAPGFLPETAVRDDVMLAEAAARDAGSAPTQAPTEVTSQQRAFPLVTGHPEGRNNRRTSESPSRHGAAAGLAGVGAGAAAAGYVGKRRRGSTPANRQRDNSMSTTEEERHRTAERAVTGKRRSSHPRSPVGKPRSHEEEPPKEEKRHSIFGLFHRRKDEGEKENRRRSASEHRREPARQDAVGATGNSPNRLRKASKGEPGPERRRSMSSARIDDEEHPNHKKEKAVAGAAAGAGAFGLFHHAKRNSKGEEIRDAANLDRAPMSASAGGAGPAGGTMQQIEEVPTPFEHPREAPMVPSEGPKKAAGNTGHSGQYNKLAFGTPSGVHSAAAPEGERGDVMSNQPDNYVIASSGVPLGITQQSVTSGVRKDERGAGQTTHNRGDHGIVTQEPGNYNIIGSGIPSGIKQQASSGYESGERSVGQKHNTDSGRDTITQEPGQYNTLASGIPSGIKQSSSTTGIGSGGRETTTGDTRDGDEDKLEYNILPSGTVSGVKVKPKSPRYSGQGADQVLHADNQAGHGQYNTLSSGTASGINPETLHHHEPQGPTNMTSGARALNDRSAPSVAATQYTEQQHEFLPVPSQIKRGRTHPQRPTNASQESLPGVTTYPHPEVTQNMSPEVMPDAYTTTTTAAPAAAGFAAGAAVVGAGAAATASKSSHIPQGQYDLTSQQQQQQAGADAPKHLSPEVMPAAYTAPGAPQSSRLHQRQQQQQQQSPAASAEAPTHMSPEVMPAAYTASSSAALAHRQPHAQPQSRSHQQLQQQPRDFDPALAPASSSWGPAGLAGAAGPGFYAGGSRPVVHRCQHCGGENDISGYLEKFAHEMGLGGGRGV